MTGKELADINSVINKIEAKRNRSAAMAFWAAIILLILLFYGLIFFVVIINS